MKTAILISGAFRGDMQTLSSIKSYLKDKLNADVFISTWDSWYRWMGFTKDDKSTFCKRIFPERLHKFIPLEFLSDNSLVMKELPNTYTYLSTPIKNPIDIQYISKKIEFNSINIINEKKFEEYSADIWGSLNQKKMFFGLYNSFNLMETYEQETGIKYDVCIRIRPDLEILESIDENILFSLKDSECFVHFTTVGGNSDQFFIAKRDTMKIICSLWLHSVNKGILSPIANYSSLNAERLLCIWLIKNNIKFVEQNFKYTFRKLKGYMRNNRKK